LKYSKLNESSHGWLIEFDQPIGESNFKQACQIAIELAKAECHLDGAVAINFVALGIPVQVVETSTIETHFSLWKQSADDAQIVPGLPAAFTNLISQMLTPGVDAIERQRG
jgi:hypothetical protein